eukprot:TRINITY_DN38378_c0_g1_i1.p2 TRINITY_DN38378_c0_g1~~TRINITY_DN38378_c0_g1_i1.p2  ORF type:complete len:185 (+),score=39.82 TRINITY_DN38378_c0_g1_i1:376-930(+)
MRYALAAVSGPVPSAPGSSVTYHFRIAGKSGSMAIAIGVLAGAAVEEVLEKHENGAGLIFGDGALGWGYVDNGELIHGTGEVPNRPMWSHGQERKWRRFRGGSVVSMTVATALDRAVRVSYAVNGQEQGLAFDSSRPADSLLAHPLWAAASLEMPADAVELVSSAEGAEEAPRAPRAPWCSESD